MALPKKTRKTKTQMATSIGRVKKSSRKAVLAKKAKGGRRGSRPVPPLPPVDGGDPVADDAPAFRSADRVLPPRPMEFDKTDDADKADYCGN